jgi:hypothetical protein
MPAGKQVIAPPFRAFLEVRLDDGRTAFASTEAVLRSPDLQRRCVEKRVLRSVIRRLDELGLLVSLEIIDGGKTTTEQAAAEKQDATEH